MAKLLTRADELKALAELRAQIRREALDRPTPVLSLAILLFHLVAMVGGMAVFVLGDPLWLRLVALWVSSYGALGIGMTGHNASHCGVTGSRRFDRVLVYLTMTVVHGISASYWIHKHVRLHHAAPNNIGHDTDIALMPFFALNEDEVGAAHGFWQRLYRIQHWLFPLVISINVLNLQVCGVMHLRQQWRQQRWRPVLWADPVCIALHVAIFLVLPSLIWSAVPVIGIYLLRLAINGYVVFAAAAPAHFPAEAKFIKGDDGGPLTVQTYTTVNFRTGFWGRLVCLGAEYQIEHHLLPEANPLKMRRVSSIVEAFCRDHHYPYRQLGWAEAIVKSLRVMREPKPVYRLSDLR
jgi:linoleoyl-CoA desaturase